MEPRKIDPDAPVGRRHEQAERRETDLVERLRGYRDVFQGMCPSQERDPKPNPIH